MKPHYGFTRSWTVSGNRGCIHEAIVSSGYLKKALRQ
jgi:hypothetical protein